MKYSKYTEANRLAWNEVAPIHQDINFQSLLEGFRKADFSCLDEIETSTLKNIGVRNKDVVQLCCNNGRELLSIKNLGASRCVGFDISDEFIKQAKSLSRESGIKCEFIQTDVYKIPEIFQETFDIVFVSVGVLRWMPDLEGFFEIVTHLLKTEGWIFIHEMHPVLDMFAENDERNPPQLQYSYFNHDPRVQNQGLDYYGKTTYNSKTMYEFHYKLSDIINSCVNHKLAMQAFNEYPNDISSVYTEFEKIESKLPLSYTLVARKIN